MIDRIPTVLEESPRLEANAAKLDAMLRTLVKLNEGRRYAAAATLGEICALFAAYSHTGGFVSNALERTLAALGRSCIRPSSPTACGRGPVRQALHVLTAAKPVGGDTRYVWRWIERDPSRQYSIALTRQMDFETPQWIRDAVARSGGQITVLDADGADAIERARRLRHLASSYDAVFVHTYVEDVTPSIAFFAGEDLPPIVFVMQADHQFFVGLTASDAVIHMRASGAALSLERRGVEPHRTTFLPIPLEPAVRSRSRLAARRELDLPEDAVVLLSIARAVKYTPVCSPTFIETAVAALERNPRAVLVVVGPPNTHEWQEAARKTQGRLRMIGQHTHVAPFYEAADVYLDSFPFASNTSLLEAGSLGLPLVSYFPFSRGADVLAAGAPGIDDVLIKASTPQEYVDAITDLVNDEDRRTRIGEHTRESIERHHSGARWREYLECCMSLLAALPPRPAIDGEIPRRREDLDELLSLLYRHEAPLGVAISRYARRLAYSERVRLLAALLPIDRSFSFEMFLPRAIARVAGPWFHGWRNWGRKKRLAVGG